MLLENIKTDAAIGVYVRVVNLGFEMELGRFERVVRRKLDTDKENST